MPTTDPKTNKTVLTPSEAASIRVASATIALLAKIAPCPEVTAALPVLEPVLAKFEKVVKKRGA